MEKFTVRKAKAFFSGTDTYCRHVEVAYADENQVFTRDYRFNRYGLAPSKWRKELVGKDFPPMSEAVARGKVDWGFKTLSGGMCA